MENNVSFKEVYDPIFKQRFILYWNCDFETFYKEVTGEETTLNPKTINGYTINTDEAEICIWVHNPQDIPTLTHEVCHAMQFALYARCFVDHREAELPAYYMGFLMTQFTNLGGNELCQH